MNRREKVIYIAGQYRGEVEKNIQRAKSFNVKIWEAGYTGLCPHMNTARFEKVCHVNDEAYLAGGLVLLGRCDAIFMLPGWENSEGARDELLQAVAQKIPIFYSIDALESHQWNKTEEESS